MQTFLELAGVGLIVAGVAFIFWPAAFVVGGAGLILISRGVGG